jgi:uncharacterized protein (TIGR02265 family)
MPPDDVERWKDRFVFPSMYEGWAKGLGDRFNANTRRELKAAGLDLERMPPAITALDNIKYLSIVARCGWPDEPEVEQLRLLGFHGIRGWQKGLLGAAVTSMLRLVGPQRTLTRLDRAFATTNNFTKATTVFVGPKEALVTVNEIHDMPSYWIGVFEAGCELLGLEGVVTTEKVDGPVGVFRISWK